MDELLVVTFTRAAAAEMRERITRELRGRVVSASDDDHERLARQLRLIERATITTIDAFCGEVVRSNFATVGIDPAFTVLAPEDAALLRADVCGDLIEHAYEAQDAEAFKTLLDGYYHGDDGLLTAGTPRDPFDARQRR